MICCCSGNLHDASVDARFAQLVLNGAADLLDDDRDDDDGDDGDDGGDSNSGNSDKKLDCRGSVVMIKKRRM